LPHPIYDFNNDDVITKDNEKYVQIIIQAASYVFRPFDDAMPTVLLALSLSPLAHHAHDSFPFEHCSQE
jgi:hypothetical protein